MEAVRPAPARPAPRVLLALALAGIATAAAARAGEIVVRPYDEIHLKGGPVLRGRLVAQLPDQVRFRPRGALTTVRPIRRDRIEKILRRQTPRQGYEAATAAIPKGAWKRRRTLARECLGYNLRAEALVEAERAAAEGGAENLATRLLAGRVALDLGQFEKARLHAEAGTGAEKASAGAHALLAAALARMGRPVEARAAVKRARALVKADPAVLAELGDVLSELGDLAEARTLFESVLKLDAKNAHALLGLGVAALRQAKLAEAENRLAAAAHESPDDADVHAALAALRQLQGDPAGARREAARSLNLNPEHAGAFVAMALAAAAEGNATKASGYYKAALAREAGGARGRAAARAEVGLAHLADRAGRDDEARAALARATGADPNDALAFYVLGEAHYRSGAFAESLVAFVRAGELAPGAAFVRRAAGAAALAAGGYAGAEKHYRAALAIDGEDAVARAGLGIAISGAGGRDGEAGRELARAIELDPKNPAAHCTLGFLANRRGGLDGEAEAIKHFEAACAADGACLYARQALSRLHGGQGANVKVVSEFFEGDARPAAWRERRANYGIRATVEKGRLVMSGRQSREGETQTVYLLSGADAYRSCIFRMDVVGKPDGGTTAGLFLEAAEGRVEVGYNPGGKLYCRTHDRNGTHPPVELGDWPEGGRLRLGIELVDRDKSLFRVTCGAGAPKDLSVPGLARATSYGLGAFTRGQLGDEVRVEFDNADIITTGKP